jgi:ADP-heptose:LPS heptosyltransferase
MNIGKKIEVLLKNSIAALLRTALEQKPKSPMPPYKRILFLRFDALGDMILSFPIYRAARSALPDTELDVLCSEKNINLLQDTQLANNLLVAGKNPLGLIKLILFIRTRNYDLIINLVTRPSFTFGLVARLGGPKATRIASEQEKFAYFYNRNLDLPPKSDIHMMKRKFLVCQDIIDTAISHIDTPWVNYNEGIKKQAQHLYNQLVSDLDLPEDKRRLAALNLTAGLERREWPLEKYVKFLMEEIEKYQGNIDGWVVLTDPGKPQKTKSLIEQVNQLIGSNAGTIHESPLHPSLIALPAQSDFRVVMEFLCLVTVLITPDTSIAHAASAMSTPVLVLTIGENATVWDPIGVTHKIVFSDDPFSLETLPVEQVIDGFDYLMREILRKK